MTTTKTSFVERERLASIAAVDDLAATWRAAYHAALLHDGLAPGTTFAVFSASNPFVPFVDKAYRQFCEAAAACAAHGYVGLSLASRDLYGSKRRAGRGKEKTT